MKPKGTLMVVAGSPFLKVTSFTKPIFQKGVRAGLFTSGVQALKAKLTIRSTKAD